MFYLHLSVIIGLLCVRILQMGEKTVKSRFIKKQIKSRELLCSTHSNVLNMVLVRAFSTQQNLIYYASSNTHIFHSLLRLLIISLTLWLLVLVSAAATDKNHETYNWNLIIWVCSTHNWHWSHCDFGWIQLFLWRFTVLYKLLNERWHQFSYSVQQLGCLNFFVVFE